MFPQLPGDEQVDQVVKTEGVIATHRLVVAHKNGPVRRVPGAAPEPFPDARRFQTAI
jgi:hypothetical protein